VKERVILDELEVLPTFKSSSLWKCAGCDLLVGIGAWSKYESRKNRLRRMTWGNFAVVRGHGLGGALPYFDE
jgi:hypothetical protein